MRSVVEINHSRIFLAFFHVQWLDHTIVEICHTISCLGCAYCHLWTSISLPWVFSCIKHFAAHLVALDGAELAYTRCRAVGISIVELCVVLVEHHAVTTRFGCETYHLLSLEIHFVEVALKRRILGCHEESRLALWIDTDKVGDKPVARCNRCDYVVAVFSRLTSLLVELAEIEMVEAALFVLIDELVVAARKEEERVLGLYIFFAFFGEDSIEILACLSAVGIECHKVLQAVELKNEDLLAIWPPRYIGQVMFWVVETTLCLTIHCPFRLVVGLEIDSCLCVRVKDTYCDLMRSHARHRIFAPSDSRFAIIGLHQWVALNHCLIHAIESKLMTRRTPENTAVDAELIAMNRLSPHDVAFLVVGNLETHRFFKSHDPWFL